MASVFKAANVSKENQFWIRGSKGRAVSTNLISVARYRNVDRFPDRISTVFPPASFRSRRRFNSCPPRSPRSLDFVDTLAPGNSNFVVAVSAKRSSAPSSPAAQFTLGPFNVSRLVGYDPRNFSQCLGTGTLRSNVLTLPGSSTTADAAGSRSLAGLARPARSLIYGAEFRTICIQPREGSG